MPQNSHQLPPHLQNLSPPGFQGYQSSNSPSSLNSDSSLHSAAVTELSAKLNKIMEKIQDQPTDTSARELATMEELAALRTENKKLLEELQTVKCDLASKNAAIKEVRQSKEEQARMHQQWTSMCTSMLGTIENIKR